MLRSLNQLRGYVLAAEDGDVGCCVDFLIDDNLWTVRYMVADTRKWLPGRKVLISPMSLGEPDWQWLRMPIKLTRQQIKDAPPLDEDAPVSRKYERRWLRYYGWPYYWTGPELWGPVPTPFLVTKQIFEDAEEMQDAQGDDANDTALRSTKELIGYHIVAEDGNSGLVDDFVVDDELWRLQYLVVALGNRAFGSKVLVPIRKISDIEIASQEVRVGLTQENVANAESYNPAEPINIKLELRHYDYYGRPVDL